MTTVVKKPPRTRDSAREVSLKVRLSFRERRMLDEIAERKGVSVADVIRMMVRERYESHTRAA